MKEQAIIPIFIPHEGCDNDCVFCNQRRITAQDSAPTQDDVRRLVERHLATMESVAIREIAFFGGSFTGLNTYEQNRYLEIAKALKDGGRIDRIRLSTRPDYIDESILDNLAAYGVDHIELGVQSFDADVLRRSNRGYKPLAIYEGSEMIRRADFDLGIQLMIGLPSDTTEKCIRSAHETVALSPATVRLYPTVVIENTELQEMYENGEFTPFSDEKMLETTKAMYSILAGAGITIIRVGLKSTDLITSANYRGYHPAYREIVESSIMLDTIRERIEPLLKSRTYADKNSSGKAYTEAVISCHPKNVSRLVGHSSSNRQYLEKKYPHLKFSFRGDSRLSSSLNSVSVLVFDRHDR